MGNLQEQVIERQTICQNVFEINAVLRKLGVAQKRLYDKIDFALRIRIVHALP